MYNKEGETSIDEKEVSKRVMKQKERRIRQRKESRLDRIVNEKEVSQMEPPAKKKKHHEKQKTREGSSLSKDEIKDDKPYFQLSDFNEIITHLENGKDVVKETLDSIQRRLQDVKTRADTPLPEDVKLAVHEIINDLKAIDTQIGKLENIETQKNWLVTFSECLEEHHTDSRNRKWLMSEAAEAQAWIEEQMDQLKNDYNQTEFSVGEGEQVVDELEQMKTTIEKYQNVLMTLTDKNAFISPLWKRRERISEPTIVTALRHYEDRIISINAGENVVLLDNSDSTKWIVRDAMGLEGQVPSVLLRFPPTDSRSTSFLIYLTQQFEKLKELWEKKKQMVRLNLVLSTMRSIQTSNTFYSNENHGAFVKDLNKELAKLLSRLEPDDPVALRLRTDFSTFFHAAQKSPEPDPKSGQGNSDESLDEHYGREQLRNESMMSIERIDSVESSTPTISTSPPSLDHLDLRFVNFRRPNSFKTDEMTSRDGGNGMSDESTSDVDVMDTSSHRRGSGVMDTSRDYKNLKRRNEKDAVDEKDEPSAKRVSMHDYMEDGRSSLDEGNVQYPVDSMPKSEERCCKNNEMCKISTPATSPDSFDHLDLRYVTFRRPNRR